MQRFIAVLAIAVLVVSAYGAPCDFQALRHQAETMLASSIPVVSGSAAYRQVLRFKDGSEEYVPSKKKPPSEDFEFREIPFAIADAGRCAVETFMESRRIAQGRLTDLLGGQLKLASRAFGPIHNDFNTQTATGDAQKVAILNKWKFYSREGYMLYTPYSADLARLFPTLATEGRLHFERDIAEAEYELRAKGMFTREELAFYRPLVRQIFPAESTDPFEFSMADETGKKRLTEAPYVILGANGDDAYTLKVSSAGAKGPMQIMPSSCRDLRGLYPAMGFSADCSSGAFGSHKHVENVAACYLELKMHRGTLVRLLGQKITRRADFDRILKASYNGGPGHVVRAFRKGERRHWDKSRYIPSETKQYLQKCDYVAQNFQTIQTSDISGTR